MFSFCPAVSWWWRKKRKTIRNELIFFGYRTRVFELEAVDLHWSRVIRHFEGSIFSTDCICGGYYAWKWGNWRLVWRGILSVRLTEAPSIWNHKPYFLQCVTPLHFSHNLIFHRNVCVHLHQSDLYLKLMFYLFSISL